MMRMRFDPRLALGSAMLAWLALPALATAQSVTTGAISGLVEDESGAVLPGASVVVLHGPTGALQSAVTGSDGTLRTVIAPPARS